MVLVVVDRGVLGAGAAGRGNQHRSARPADALPSAEAALLGRVYRTEPDPTHPVPQRPTRRALPPPVVRAKTLLQHPRASSHYVALMYVASDGAEHLDQPTDLPDGYHKSSALDPEGV